MNRKGFGLVEMVIVIGIIAVLGGGGFYFKSLQNNADTVKMGVTAEQQAREAVHLIASTTSEQTDALNQITGVAPAPAPAGVSDATAPSPAPAASIKPSIKTTSSTKSHFFRRPARKLGKQHLRKWCCSIRG